MARSAGILLFRRSTGTLEVLLVHPGGPFWARKDLGAWSIPKGEYASDEDPWAAARREFEEELGHPPLASSPIPLGEVVQKNGKHVTAFAVEGDFDITTLRSNTFQLEWPPKSGRLQVIPEVDRAEWFDIPTARAKINAAQAELLDRLVGALG